jgi:GDP-L-fucose synthase
VKQEKIFIAGHRGMVGSSILGKLEHSNYSNIVTRTRQEMNLMNKHKVLDFFRDEKIDTVILCAAKVGGILANNTYRADFLYDNLQISSTIIKAAQKFGVKKLINLGSSCIYPKHADIPIKEEYLLTGPLEHTNEPYAIAKIAALKMCESFYDQYGCNFYSVMPCNLYGPRDNFDLKSSHVLPALINKIHCAKEKGDKSIEVWGSGKPLREFLYVEDLADGVIHCMENINAEDIYSDGVSHINCGSEHEVTILELVHLIQDAIGYDGEIVFDSSKPDGTFRKKMDNTRIKSKGFSPKVTLKDGIVKTYKWYLENLNIDCNQV